MRRLPVSAAAAFIGLQCPAGSIEEGFIQVLRSNSEFAYYGQKR